MLPPVDFVIITPLEEERDALLSKFPEYQQLPPSEDDIRVYFLSHLPVTFPDGLTGTYRVVVMLLLGMGRVEATAATGDVIRRWCPRYVLLVGIAGGVAKQGVNLGDVLISDQIVDYEEQKITPESSEVRWKVQPVDQRLLGAALNFRSDSWYKLVTEKRPDIGIPKRHKGPIASGDKVIAFNQILEKYGEVWTKLIGTEMEAGGVSVASLQSPTRPGFFMVRGVSDLADEEKGSVRVEKWRSYACDVAATYTVELLKSGPVPLSPVDESSSVVPQSSLEPEVSLEKTQVLEDSECKKLADLLKRSGRASHLARRALCIDIGIDPDDLDFIAQTAPSDFAKQLVFELNRRGNKPALLSLCIEIAPRLGSFADDFAAIKTKLSRENYGGSS